ncbi:MAG: SusC/RagA family TonB-linked outer membrane protein [Prevotella sp.]|nr:SusC/RagA family TonB-linked outer membrane protein [Prevotella sp.]MDY4038389.1 SusC/RagA family TonB-linked outer membrane protein [Prevotella sp.]
MNLHKWVWFVWLSFCFLMTPSGTVSAQSQRDRITIETRNEPMPSVFKKIEKLTQYKFIFDYAEVNQFKVTVKLKNATIGEAMNKIIGKHPLRFTVNDSFINIVMKKPDGLLAEVKGKVFFHDDRSPCMGASVKVDGKLVATTDAGGCFTLHNVSSYSYLDISYIGMEDEHLQVSPIINAYLKTSTESLENVVVTGIFRKNRESFTGAVSTIDSKQLKSFKGKNLISTLKNIDPTFNVLENNQFGGDPNHLASVQIRGTSSLPTVEDLKNETRVDINTPLIILDGFEISLSRMQDMNDEDIESITILKDGSATAIYGSRGANGVIVIQSKRPEAGKLRVSYRGALQLEVPDLTGYDMLNAREKLQLELDGGLYKSNFSNIEMSLRERYNTMLENVERGVDTYWLSKPLRTGVGHRHNLRLEGGGSEGFRYAAALQFNDVKGVMKGSDRKTFNANIDLMYERNTLLFTNNLEISHLAADESPYGSFSQYVKLNPYWTERDPEGNILKTFEPQNENFFNPAPENPLYNATLDMVNRQKSTTVSNNFNIEWRPTEDFTLRTRFSIAKRFLNSDLFKPAAHTDFKDYSEDQIFRKGKYQYSTDNGFDYDLGITANYAHTFHRKHSLYVGLNFNMAEQSSDAYTFVVEGFPQPTYKQLTMALQYEDKGRPTGDEALNRRMGLTGNVNYIFDNRYFADFAYRIDGASQFGKNKRFAPFYSTGLGWNIHQEKFMKRISWINRLKLRGSWAVTGAVNFRPYQALGTYEYYTNDRYRYWFGTHLMGIANKDLEWQRTDKFDVGVELDVLDSRFKMILDLYRNTTDNLLSEMNLPLANGFPSYTANIGKVRNQGLELALTANILRGEDVNWSVSASMIHEKNRILKISDALKAANADLEKQGGANPNFLYREGEALRTIYVVPSYGIDPSNGMELYRDRFGNATYTWNAADRVACGVEDPKFRGNINSMMNYKNWSLNVSFSYRLGGDIYNSTLVNRVENADLRYNVDRRVYEDRWKKPGDHTFFKNILDRRLTQMSSRFVQTEYALECQSLMLKYDMPKKVASYLHAQFVSLAFTTDNLFRLSSIKQERGISYPFSHRYSLSLSVIF